MADFRIGTNLRQEEFSRAWLAALASAAGFTVQRIVPDVDSIDAEIRQKGDGADFPIFSALSVQLKCTFACSPKNGGIKLQVSRKNYDDLRGERSTPGIIVVLHVPKQLTGWLTHGTQEITLKNCAYWVSIRGRGDVKAQKKVSIEVPTSQELTVAELTRLMRLAAEGKFPEASL